MAKKVVGKKSAPEKVSKPTASIPALLKELEACDDQLEKRKIRAKLRKLGHTGGIQGAGTKKAADKKRPAKGKNRKVKAQVEEDDDE